MKNSGPPSRLGLPAAIAGMAILFLFGCETTGGGYTEVYGDYGYQGPWVEGGIEPAGYRVDRPPFDRDHPDDRGGHPEVQRHEEPHGPPSIPNRPRAGGGGGDRGGGGHPGGGGGGRSSGGGGGDHHK